MSTATETDYEPRPHPADTSAAETATVRRRIGYGIFIALSLNLLFLTGGAAVANYLSGIFTPLLERKFGTKDHIVWIRLPSLYTPQSSASPAPTPAP